MVDFAKMRRKAEDRYRRLAGHPDLRLPDICAHCQQRIEGWEPVSVVEACPLPLVVHRECRSAALGEQP